MSWFSVLVLRVSSVQRWPTTARAASSFITTPIFYVNAAPHIGHLYSALLADVAHRWRILKGVEPAVFSTGTDEHGLKIQKAAAAMNKDPLTLCNDVSGQFKDMFDKAGISYTHYIRTTETQHVKKVEEFWSRLYDRGHIYKDSYSGWYCVSDETFLADDQITHSPELGCKVSVESGHPVEWGTEENYLFRLSDFREQLLDWVNTPPYPIVPEFARRLVLSWLRKGLNDLSVSRPKTRLHWGIPVPNDPSQTIYVWLDALINYLTVSGHPLPNHVWPPTEHVVGKDILRFHAVYWPAFLLAAGLELPRRIVTHSHWIVQHTKMSKSKGNVVNPLQQFSQFGVEPVRYYLLKEGYLHHDGDYSSRRLVNVVNSDLANTLGNLLQRISSKRLAVGGSAEGRGLRYRQELLPFSSQQGSDDVRVSRDDRALIERLQKLPALVDSCYEEFRFSVGLEEIMRCLYQTNQFVQNWAPWNLIKDPAEHHTLQTVLLVAMESVRLSGCLLYPVLPQHCSRLLHQLGAVTPPTPDDLKCKLSESGVRELERLSENLHNHDSKPLFTKLELL